jgi:proteic killer suppression protein
LEPARDLCNASRDICRAGRYNLDVIRSFTNKGLADLWAKGSTPTIDARLHKRITRRLEALDKAGRPEDLALPGHDFHPLRGFSPVRYTVHVNGPWCITFEFEQGDAYRVDFEQYH